jgi:hypothetical protein
LHIAAQSSLSCQGAGRQGAGGLSDTEFKQLIANPIMEKYPNIMLELGLPDKTGDTNQATDL